MAQHLKDAIRRCIADAALATFAEAGLEGATMAAMAGQAGISTGNLYRYFASKQALFSEVVPDAFVAELSGRLGLRLQTSQEVVDVRELAPGHPYLDASEALLDYVIEHRLQTVIVLGRAEGTSYAGLRETLVERLVRAALDHYGRTNGARLGIVLREIYGNYVNSLVVILRSLEGADEIREAVEGYQRYHLVGLDALLRSQAV